MCYWHRNRIRIFGNAERMRRELQRALENSLLVPGTGAFKDRDSSWLGWLVRDFNVGTVGENLPSDVSCRGKIISMDVPNENELVVETQTAESPNVSLFRRIFPEAEISYSSIGSDGYTQSNDTELIGKYRFDFGRSIPEGVNVGEWDFVDEEQAKNIARKILDSSEDDVTELARMLNHRFRDCVMQRVEPGSADQLDGVVEFEIS